MLTLMTDKKKSDEDLKQLHEKLYRHLDNQTKNWKSFIFAKDKGFYQGFDEIKITGWRNTENRFRSYNIEKYLSKNKKILDIGCNTGFFTLSVSRFVENIVGVEINPYLIDIANDVKKYLQIHNASFQKSSFEDFAALEKFDVVFSLANDETIDGNTKFTFKEYVEKITQILKNDGLLIFESQAADAYDRSKFEPKLEFLNEKFTVLEDRIVLSEYPVNVPERIFLILEKK